MTKLSNPCCSLSKWSLGKGHVWIHKSFWRTLLQHFSTTQLFRDQLEPDTFPVRCSDPTNECSKLAGHPIYEAGALPKPKYSDKVVSFRLATLGNHFSSTHWQVRQMIKCCALFRRSQEKWSPINSEKHKDPWQHALSNPILLRVGDQLSRNYQIFMWLNTLSGISWPSSFYSRSHSNSLRHIFSKCIYLPSKVQSSAGPVALCVWVTTSSLESNHPAPDTDLVLHHRLFGHSNGAFHLNPLGCVGLLLVHCERSQQQLLRNELLEGEDIQLKKEQSICKPSVLGFQPFV